LGNRRTSISAQARFGVYLGSDDGAADLVLSARTSDEQHLSGVGL
jgi:hypothetical protein